MDQWTDRLTDRWMDKPSYRDVMTHLKMLDKCLISKNARKIQENAKKFLKKVRKCLTELDNAK